MIPGITEETWLKVSRIIHTAISDANHARNACPAAALVAIRVTMEYGFMAECKKRVDSVRQVADLLDELRTTHYQAWENDKVEPFDEYAISLHGLAEVARQGIESIRTIIDPEPDPHHFSPADMRNLVMGMSRDFAEHILTAELGLLMATLYRKFPAVVQYKKDDETEADYFGRLGERTAREFLKRREH